MTMQTGVEEDSNEQTHHDSVRVMKSGLKASSDTYKELDKPLQSAISSSPSVPSSSRTTSSSTPSSSSVKASISGDTKSETKQMEVFFRNYIPRDKNLRRNCRPRPSVVELEKSIDSRAAEITSTKFTEDVLAHITPVRPNWDLKRDIEGKLKTLRRRTDKAVVQLIKEKVEANKLSLADIKSPAAALPKASSITVGSSGTDNSETDLGVATSATPAISTNDEFTAVDVNETPETLTRQERELALSVVNAMDAVEELEAESDKGDFSD